VLPPTTCTTYTTRATHATWTACSANTTSTSDTANAASTTYPANATDSANSTCTAHTSCTTPPTRQLGRPVAAANVGIAIEIIVVIDIDGVVAAPAAPIAPTATPHCAHRDTNAERYRHPRRIVSGRRVVNRRIGVHRWSIHHDWIVRRYVHHLRIRLLDDNRALVFDDLGLYFLLLTRLQIASTLSLLTHPLDCIHHIVLLRQKRVAEISCPLDIVCQALDQVGQSSHGLDAWVPRLLGHCISKGFIFQARILRKPLLELNNLKRIRGGGKGLGQHRIWKERNRRNKRIQLVRRNLGSRGRRCRRRRFLRSGGLQLRHCVTWNDRDHTDDCYQSPELSG
jgi:hypothetical protein